MRDSSIDRVIDRRSFRSPHWWKLAENQIDTGSQGVRIVCVNHDHHQTVFKKDVKKYLRGDKS